MINKSLLGDLNLIYLNTKKNIYKIYQNSSFYDKKISRILSNKAFFDYPISLNFQTLRKLGFIEVFVIGFSYLKSVFFPIKHENSLEDFLINRFGKRLYLYFFKRNKAIQP